MPILQMRKQRYMEQFNYFKVTQPGEWWSQDSKPGSQTPECELLANWKAYVERLQYSTHCTRPFHSLASFSALANLMGYIFPLFYGWADWGREQWARQWESGRSDSRAYIQFTVLHGMAQGPPPTWVSYLPFLSNYVLNIQVGCQDNHSETTWKANDFSDILQPGWFLL